MESIDVISDEQRQWLHARACKMVAESNKLLVRLRQRGMRENHPLLVAVKHYAHASREMWHYSIDDWRKGIYRRAVKRSEGWPKI